MCTEQSLGEEIAGPAVQAKKLFLLQINGIGTADKKHNGDKKIMENNDAPLFQMILIIPKIMIRIIGKEEIMRKVVGRLPVSLSHLCSLFQRNN